VCGKSRSRKGHAPTAFAALMRNVNCCATHIPRVRAASVACTYLEDPMANITLRRPWRSPLLPLFERDQELLPANFRRIFDTMTEPMMPTESVGLMPAVEIAETAEEFTCSAELPGLKLKDIHLSFEDGALMLKGEKHDEREQKDGKRYHMWERSYGAFSRTFTFPSKIDADKILANFNDGVLTVHLPKTADAKAKARPIEILAK